MREINEKKTMARITCAGSTKLIYKAQLSNKSMELSC